MHVNGRELHTRAGLVLGILALGLLVACSNVSQGVGSPPTATSLATPTTTTLELAERPLAELSIDAQEFLEGREGKWGVAVVVPSHRRIYAANGDQLMPMASIAKVAIMLTTMDRAVQDNRDITERDLELLRPMITESDNDAADLLWKELGGGAALEAYLRSEGIIDIVADTGDYWGASRASAKSAALLFAKIAFGETLEQPWRDLAFDLLSSVIPSQRWGVTAGMPSEWPSGTVIGLKNGWYPADYDDWWVNSAGMIIPGGDRPAYTIAVLTTEQPSWEYGIATIEGVAERVHVALQGHLVLQED